MTPNLGLLSPPSPQVGNILLMTLPPAKEDHTEHRGFTGKGRGQQAGSPEH